jgi:hypothetical protein
MTACVLLSDFKQPYSFPRSLSRRTIVSFRSSFNKKNEGGAGRQRLAGLHGLVCRKVETHEKFLLTAVTGSTRHPARDV